MTLSIAAAREWHGVDTAMSRDQTVAANQPAVLRGLIKHCQVVRAAASSERALGDYIKGFDSRAQRQAGTIDRRSGNRRRLQRGANPGRRRGEGAVVLDRQSGITQLAAIFPNRSFDPSDAAEYNRLSIEEFDRVRDFIILHCKATTRADAPLWQYCRNMEIAAELGYRSNLFRSSGRVAVYDRELFVESNGLSIFIGQGIWPQRYDPLADVLQLKAIRAHMAQIRNLIRQTAEAMPTHPAFIDTRCRARSGRPG